MKVLIVGATGTIGREVTNLFHKEGHEVIAASRSSNPKIDITDLSSIEEFYKKTGEVDVIITTAGDAAFVALDKLNDQEIELSLQSKLMGQINTVRKGLKYLKPNGVFVVTGGMLAYGPWPQTTMLTMVNAGLEGFVKAAALDLTEGRKIVIVHPPYIAETALAMGMDASPWPKAATAAQAYLEAATGNQTGSPVFVKGYEPSAK